MKLFRWIDQGMVLPGVLISGEHYDAAGFGEDYDETFFSSGGLDRLAIWTKEMRTRLKALPKGIELSSPISRPSKIVCIGLNYADHAQETGAEKPAEPVIFLKSTTSLCGPNDSIIIPKGSEKTDWEVELAVVIKKKASYVAVVEAMDFVAGYCLHNDVSERAFQLERGGTWDKGKGCDHFAPLGPWLVTTEEIADVNNLRLWLTVNGKMVQDSNTANLIFKIPFLVSYVSQFMTLLPGDIISTGTPAGVGLGMKPPVFLNPGDIIELGIDGLGTARQTVVAYESVTK